MIIQIEGGLFSRLDVLSSIINSKHYPDLIQIVWNPAEGVDAHFHELFENDIEFVNGDHYDNFEHKKYHAGEHIDPRLEKNHTIYLIADHPILFEDTVPLGHFFADSYGHKFNNLFRDLRPVKHLQDKIKEICEQYKNLNWYGFNIRRGIGLNYHPNSNIMSPTHLFIQKAKEIFELHGGNRIVVTTDSYSDLEQLCMRYYDRLIFVKEYMKYPINDGYNLAGMERSVIDWFLLTKCQRIYCGFEAGFAIRAARSFEIWMEELVTREAAVINYYAAAIERRKIGIF